MKEKEIFQKAAIVVSKEFPLGYFPPDNPEERLLRKETLEEFVGRLIDALGEKLPHLSSDQIKIIADALLKGASVSEAATRIIEGVKRERVRQAFKRACRNTLWEFNK